MDSRALALMFQQGHYQDYNLAEHEFTRRFCELTQPARITCVGGGTNLDVFYASQECEPRVTNWDPGFQGVGEPHWRDLQRQYQALTNFRGEYTWIQQSVREIHTVTDTDLLWLCHDQAGEHLDQIQDWPNSMIVAHYGDLTMTAALLRAHRHLPMRALGHRLAVFSREEHDWHHGTYRLTQDRVLGPINPVNWIMR
jgi:hypothetical protein